jgi:hypothetical protein
MAYCTNTEVKTLLGGIDGSGDDTLLTTLITEAEVFIENHTHRLFEAETLTKSYDAMRDVDGPTLWLDEDLLSITTLTNGDGDTLASTEYVLLPTNKTPYYAIKLLASSGVAWTFVNDPEEAISVAGSWGYAASVPIAIKYACKLLTAYYYRSRQADPDADRTVFANGVVIPPSRIPRMVEEILMPYVKVFLP